MEKIQKKFDYISQTYLSGEEICKLHTQVEASQVGDFMIESFN